MTNKKPVYRVFENGVRCKDCQVLGWETDTFVDSEEAFIHMLMWCLPISKKEVEKTFYNTANQINFLNVELGKEYELSMGGVPILMKVEEIYE